MGDDGSRTDKSDIGGDLPVCSTCPFYLARLLGRVPQQVLGTAVIVLATGLVLCILEFIYLSFLYPSNLSTVIGVATPILSLLWHSKGALQRRRLTDGGIDGDTDLRRKP